MSHELHRLQVEEEMLMRKYYEYMAAQGLIEKVHLILIPWCCIFILKLCRGDFLLNLTLKDHELFTSSSLVNWDLNCSSFMHLVICDLNADFNLERILCCFNSIWCVLVMYQLPK